MKKSILVVSSFFVVVSVLAQESFNASGGEISNSFGSISYSIGQVSDESISNSTGSVSQGVQQSYEISVLEIVENNLSLSLTVYPNPTQEQFNLRVGNFQNEQLKYRLLDFEGKVISEETMISEETTIDVKQLPAATYFVEVHNASKKVQTFKIIKNQ